ncbi:MAG: hypothetical protein NTV29_04575 [Planctomycetota bacterium]|nr:hypothetical protein [Planctomycetota bacterium]
MSLSLDEIRLLCTKAEYALVSDSRTPAIEQLTSMQLKTNAANARKLVDKWQKLSRGQSRDESRTTGEPDLASKTYSKHQVMHEALEAYQARLATVATTTSVEATPKKLTPRERTASARVSRQAARTELQGVKKTVNKVAKARSIQAAAKKSAPVKAAPVKAAPVKAAPVKAAPVKAAAKAAPVKSAPVKPAVKAATKKAPAAKTEAAKKTLVKTAAKRTAKRAVVAGSAPVLAGPKKVVKTTAKPGILPATPATKAQLAGNAKANRAKLSNRTSNIAGHVSAKGKRAQSKRDSKGR